MNDTAPQPLFTRPDGRPLPEGHHLDTHRGAYRVKVTIDLGTKFTGKRICQPLRTRDPIKAAFGRDVAIEVLSRAGCLCRDIVLTDQPDEPAAGDKTSAGDSSDNP